MKPSEKSQATGLLKQCSTVIFDTEGPTYNWKGGLLVKWMKNFNAIDVNVACDSTVLSGELSKDMLKDLESF